MQFDKPVTARPSVRPNPPIVARRFRFTPMMAGWRASVAPAVLALGAALTGACAGAADMLERPPDFERSDSAGTTIVTNNRIDERFLKVWSVDTVPAFTIGGLGSDQEFAGVRGVRQLPNGTIVVLDGAGESAYEFRFFDSTGKHLATHGRRGDGPGEYRWVNHVGAAGGDTIVAVDFGARRISWLSASTGYLTSIQVDENGLKRLLGADASGLTESMIPLADSVYGLKAFRYSRDANTREETNTFHIVDARTGKVSTLPVSRKAAPIRRLELSGGPQFMSTRVEEGDAIHAADPSRQRLCAAATTAGELHCATPSGERMIMRWPVDTVPYTADDRSQFEQQIRAAYERSPGMSAADVNLIVAAFEFPDHFNPVRWFTIDADGNFWVLQNTTVRGQRSTRFLILNPEGEQIALASAFPLQSTSGLNRTTFIGSSYVLRRIMDANGAPAVGAFRIRKPE